MILGADFFASHRVYFSAAQKKVYFTYGGGSVFEEASKSLTLALAEPAPTVGPPAFIDFPGQQFQQDQSARQLQQMFMQGPMGMPPQSTPAAPSPPPPVAPPPN